MRRAASILTRQSHTNAAATSNKLLLAIEFLICIWVSLYDWFEATKSVASHRRLLRSICNLFDVARDIEDQFDHLTGEQQ